MSPWVDRCQGCGERVETHAPGESYTVLEPNGPKWHIGCAAEEADVEIGEMFSRKLEELPARIARHRDARLGPGTAERIELADGEFKL